MRFALVYGIILLGLLVALMLFFQLNVNPQEIKPAEIERSAKDSSPYITEYVLPRPYSAPMGITLDAKGDVWVLATNTTTLLRFSPVSKSFTEFKIPTQAKTSSMWGITSDKNGKIWFTSTEDNSIWSFNPADKLFTQYSIPTPSSFPIQIAIDRQGEIWFTELYGGKLGRISPSSGELKEYEPPSKDSGPGGLFIGSDGSVWFVESFANKIARFNVKANTFTEYAPAKPVYSPTDIIVDRFGYVWIVEHGGSHFARFNQLNNSVMKFTTSTEERKITLPYWLAIDPQGRMWFNEHVGNRMARFDPSEEVLIEYELPRGSKGGIVNALRFAVSQDGTVWFTEWTENKIGIVNVTKQVPFKVDPSPRRISAKPGEEIRIKISISGISDKPLLLHASGTFSLTGRLVNITAQFSSQRIPKLTNDPQTVELILRSSESLAPGNYVITIGASDGALIYSRMIHLEVKEKFSP